MKCGHCLKVLAAAAQVSPEIQAIENSLDCVSGFPQLTIAKLSRGTVTAVALHAVRLDRVQ